MTYQSTMTYQDYLDHWDEDFGDTDTADYGYWRHGTHIDIVIQRLTEAEFNEHLKGLNDGFVEFDAAVKANDDAAMGAAMANSFPHELALLV